MSHVWRAVVVVVAAGLLGGGASCRPDADATDHCPARECADEACSEAVPCPGGVGCPQGTTCFDDTCVVSPPSIIEPDTLIVGFDAREFDLGRASAGPAAYELTAPDGADRVACGLFTCKPAIVESDAGRRIVNTAQCLQREHVFNTQRSGELQTFKFGLGDLRPPEPDSCRSAMLGLGDGRRVPRTGYPLVEALRIGCWASDRTHVIAATRLVPIGVTDLPEGDRLMRRDCQETADGTWCILPGDLGVCAENKCDFTRVPSADTLTEGAGGDATVAPKQGAEAVADCRGIEDGAACRRKEVDSIGQCLSGRCLKQSEAEYTQPLAVSDCAAQGAATNWLNCYPSPTLSFGTCCGAVCRLRCRDDNDCTATLDDAGVADPRPEKCHRAPGSYLGVCVLPEESEPCKSE